MGTSVCVCETYFLCFFVFAYMCALLFIYVIYVIIFMLHQIDTKKMPLGKLSKKQIERAYRVLAEALDLLGKLEKKPAEDGDGAAGFSEAAVNAQLLDCSNRFYTLIPHDFGMKTPPLLNDLELIKVLFSDLLTVSINNSFFNGNVFL